MEIIVDLDGVCYDFVGELTKYVESETGEKLPPATTYNFFWHDWGMPHAEYHMWRNKALHARKLFYEGDPLPGCIETLTSLRAAGHKIHLVTARDADTESATHRWLGQHKIPFDRVTFSSEKQEFRRAEMAIDDNIEQVQNMRDAGINAFLMSQPWNAEAENLPRVASWREFENRVIEHAMYGKSGIRPCLLADAPELWPGPAEEVRVVDPRTGGEKGQKLAQLGAMDPAALLKLAAVAGFGGQKYARYNFAKGYAWSLSFDAMARHMLAFWNGENLDPESGLPHVLHAAWHGLTLACFLERGLGTDDRFPKEGHAA